MKSQQKLMTVAHFARSLAINPDLKLVGIGYSVDVYDL